MPDPHSAWPATQWTLVCRCGTLPPEQRREELGRLVDLYRGPIEAALEGILTRRGCTRARARAWAEELAADFVGDRWIVGNMLGRIDRHGPARFKTLLWKCLSDYATDALRRSTRHARGLRSVEPPSDSFPDAARDLDRAIALEDLREALADTQRWCEQRGWDETFHRFCRTFTGEGPAESPLPERTWRDRRERIRLHLLEALRRRVASSCLDAEEVERELSHTERLLLELRGARWTALGADGRLEVRDA